MQEHDGWNNILLSFCGIKRLHQGLDQRLWFSPTFMIASCYMITTCTLYFMKKRRNKNKRTVQNPLGNSANGNFPLI